MTYPRLKIIRRGNNFFESKTLFLKRYLNTEPVTKNLFQPVLFPDQVVYLNSKIIDRNGRIQWGNKFFINKNDKSLVYLVSPKEALTIEEIMVAHCYIKENIKRMRLKINGISTADINFITKMDSEKYRQELLKSANC